jgi:hypothetical protein
VKNDPCKPHPLDPLIGSLKLLAFGLFAVHLLPWLIVLSYWLNSLLL